MARLVVPRPVRVSLAIYLATRAVLLLATIGARQVAVPRPTLGDLVSRWDASYYLYLIDHGYPSTHGHDPHHAFFPLYPLLVRAVDAVSPGGTVDTASVVSLLAGAVAAVLMWYIGAAFAGADRAAEVVVVFCVFPGTVVFMWPYADALLLALVCGVVLLLLRRRWLLASTVAAFATACRPSGLAVVAACALVAWQETRGSALRRGACAVAAGGIAASGFVLFLGWLGRRTRDPLHWFHVEREAFDEGTPWKRLPTTLLDIFRSGPRFDRMMVVLFLGIALILLVAGLTSSQPLWAKTIVVSAMYLALSANIASVSPRMQLAAVPAFPALVARLRRDDVIVWCAVSAGLAAVLVFVYGLTISLAP